MLSFEGRRIYLACGITDGRKSINGLANTVKYSFQKDPTEESIFVFCNKKRDRLKILEYDGSGYWGSPRNVGDGMPKNIDGIRVFELLGALET